MFSYIQSEVCIDDVGGLGSFQNSIGGEAAKGTVADGIPSLHRRKSRRQKQETDEDSGQHLAGVGEIDKIPGDW